MVPSKNLGELATSGQTFQKPIPVPTHVAIFLPDKI